MRPSNRPLFEVNKMDDAIWEEAYEWALLRATEEGDVDIDYDYDIIERWMDEYYNYITN
jgi:hypothetical protein